MWSVPNGIDKNYTHGNNWDKTGLLSRVGKCQGSLGRRDPGNYVVGKGKAVTQ